MTRRFSQRRTLFPFFLFFFLIETRPVEGIERGDKLTRVSHDASFPLFRDPPAARGRFRFTRVPRTALVKRIDRVKPGPSRSFHPLVKRFDRWMEFSIDGEYFTTF